MDNFNMLGKILIISGFLLIIAGVFFMLWGKIPFLGRLPGDFYIQKNNFTFYFPIITCLLISIMLSLIFWIFARTK